MFWPVSESDLYLRPVVEVPIKEILSIYLKYQTNYISNFLKSYHSRDCEFVVSFRVARLLHQDFLRHKGVKNFTNQLYIASIPYKSRNTNLQTSFEEICKIYYYYC